ncbi:MAG: ELM1/GtrOC1 family putative glycosyltransferase [Candidatus Omnitrophica bacterium]|nr:ELM1/GtrOC1 family putative glycosyltransferase [Candidatus Omnitrophota bacterium]
MLVFLDNVLAILVLGVTQLYRVIPAGLMLAAGRFAGGIAFRFNTERKRGAYANLRAAWCRTKTPSELYRMNGMVFKNLGEVLSETMCFEKINKAYVDRYITVERIDRVDEAIKKGKGVILLTAHFGNWELSSIVAAFKGFNLLVLAREQKMKKLNSLLDRLRESKGAKVVRKGITTRLIMKALHEGNIVGMLADQNAGSNGILVPFFGRLASTADGPFRFAAKTGATVIPVFTARTGGPYTRIVVEEPITVKDGDDMMPHMVRYNRLLEKHILLKPDHWLWLHRRWKLCPEKKIVILSDNKAGHLNQSLSLAESFRQYRHAKGIPPDRASVEVIDVRFKSKWRKMILNLWSVTASVRCQGCLKCLQWGLEPSSYEKIERTYADVVISTGFSLAGINKIAALENNAKNAVCMRPGFLSTRRFNLVVLPRHDSRAPMAGRNVVITDTAPNLVRKESLEGAGRELLKNVKKDHEKTVGLLLGGDNAEVRYTNDEVGNVLAGIIAASKERGADILATTSRRTQPALEGLVREKLQGEPLCKLLIIANEKNPAYAVNGILAASDVVVISGESISMVSEAVASGKNVIVFQGTKNNEAKTTKFDRFLWRLEENKCIRRVPASDMEKAVREGLEAPPQAAQPGREDFVYLNMWRLGG